MSFLLHRQGVMAIRPIPPQPDEPAVFFEDTFGWGTGALAQRPEWEDWATPHDNRRLFAASASGGYAHPEAQNRWSYALCTVDPGPDQFAEARVTAWTSLSQMQIRMRVQENRDYWRLTVSSTTWSIAKTVNGVSTTVDNGTLTLPATPFVLRGEAVGAELRFFADGAQIGPTVTDTDLPAGRTGLMMSSGTNANTSVRISRFACGTL